MNDKEADNESDTTVSLDVKKLTAPTIKCIIDDLTGIISLQEDEEKRKRLAGEQI